MNQNARETFASAPKLAIWIDTWIIKGLPWQDDLLLIDKANELTHTDPHLRERCAKEASLLRTAGAALVALQYYDDEFYGELLASLVNLLASSFMLSTLNEISGLEDALDFYVRTLGDKHTEVAASRYMSRVYQDADIHLEESYWLMGYGGFVEIFLLFRDASCKAIYGFSYEAWTAIRRAGLAP